MIQCDKKHLLARCAERGYCFETALACTVPAGDKEVLVDIRHPAYPHQRRYGQITTLGAHRKKPKLRIDFFGFWPGFNPFNNFFTSLLLPEYDIEICDKPDFLFFSTAEQLKQTVNAVKIFYSGENTRPDLKKADWAFSFDYLQHDRHFRLPLWALGQNLNALLQPCPRVPKSKFCAFLVSNEKNSVRNDFFHALSQYKRVDSGGSVFNNIGRRVMNKFAFFADYKFVIAFENASYPGYTTEKIVDVMLAGAVPIYWGDPLIEKDFDPRSFLSAHHTQSIDTLIDRVIAADTDDAVYDAMLTAPKYQNNCLPNCANPERIREQFNRIFTS